MERYNANANNREVEKESKKRKLFVFFMTDGCDTCNSEGQVNITVIKKKEIGIPFKKVHT